MSLRDFQAQPDPMMDGLRKIRDEIGAHMLTLSPEERSEWLTRETDVFLEENGYELRPHPTNPQWEQIVKKGA